MAEREPTWGNGDRERRQQVAQELQQLKLMGKSLRTKAMRSFMKRAAAERLDAERPATTVKPPAVAA